MSFHFSYDWKQVRRCWCKKMKISQSHTREEAWGPELIFVTDITDFIRGEKTVMWRNFSFLYRIWTIYGVLSKFMSFLFQIYVEKNLCGENLCGEKMTSKRSLGGDFQRTIIFYLRDINSSAVIKVKRASWDGHTTQVQPLMMNHDCWKLFFVLVKSFFSF